MAMSYEVEHVPTPDVPVRMDPCDLPDPYHYPVGTRIRCTTQHRENLIPGVKGLIEDWTPPCDRRYELKKRFGSRHWKEILHTW